MHFVYIFGKYYQYLPYSISDFQTDDTIHKWLN